MLAICIQSVDMVGNITYFEIITTIAIGLGIIFGNLFKPGLGLDADKLPKGDISTYESTADAAEKSTYGNHIIDTIVSIIPTNIFEALAAGELLPIIFFCCILRISYCCNWRERTAC